jgi:hypothetical protein
MSKLMDNCCCVGVDELSRSKFGAKMSEIVDTRGWSLLSVISTKMRGAARAAS